VTPLRSLRSRLVLGAVLWTIGLFTVSGVFMTQVMFRHPQAPRVVHHAFAQIVPLSLLAVVCMVAGLAQVRRGLAPLSQLRERLSGVRDGRERHVDGDYPAEVQPLVNDLNALLDHREQAVRRAQAKAGDLAHGLKTPLAVLAQESERLGRAGHRELAAVIAQQVDRMRGQVEYHLAHARAAAAGATSATRCSVRDTVEGLIRTLARLHAGRGLSIAADIPEDHAVRGQREDLDEMLGNLLDNACKWAKSRVTVSSSKDAGWVVITVDDDGPGLDPSLHDKVLARGVRADEAAPGSGFGLAIVRELAELYGGRIVLDRAPAGGLRARLALPRG
jgi:signal transduction histidine kinase